MYVMTMCGLMDGGLFLLPFPITFWCNSIHCRVSIVTRHGMLTLAQGIEVDNWLCLVSGRLLLSPAQCLAGQTRVRVIMKNC